VSNTISKPILRLSFDHFGRFASPQNHALMQHFFPMPRRAWHSCLSIAPGDFDRQFGEVFNVCFPRRLIA
jgi:hypothetical protein